MGYSNLSLIKPGKTKLKTLQGATFILEQLEAHFGKVVCKSELKFMPSFILYVCCLVEEAYSDKRNIENGKISKKDEVIKTMNEFLKVTLNDQDKKVITEIIEDLHSSRRIKRVSYATQLLFHVSRFFLKPT